MSELAYAAGFIDGEGSIGIYADAGRNYAARLVVANNDPRPLHRLAQAIGGTVSPAHRGPRPGHRHQSYRLRIVGRERLMRALTDLLPYLTTKRGQAELALTFLWHQGDRRRFGRRGVDPLTRAEDESFAEALRIAKKENL